MKVMIFVFVVHQAQQLFGGVLGFLVADLVGVDEKSWLMFAGMAYTRTKVDCCKCVYYCRRKLDDKKLCVVAEEWAAIYCV